MVQTFGLSCNQMKLLVSSKYYQYYRRSLFYKVIEYKTMLRWSLCHLVDLFGKHISSHVQRSLHSFPTYLSCMFLRYHTCCMNCNRFHWSNISCCPDQTAWCSPHQQLMCMSCTSQLCSVCPQLSLIVCRVLDQRFYSIQLSSIQLKINRKKIRGFKMGFESMV